MTIQFGPFEWDENKDRVNQKKHGVSFETAAWVLSHAPAESVFFINDDCHSDDEDRLIAMVPYPEEPHPLFVISITERDDDDEEVTRIISARYASERERAVYVAWKLG